MIEHLDQQLFLFLNSHNSPFFDRLMLTVSGIPVWFPLYAAILFYLGFKYKRKFVIIVLFIILAAVMADQLSVLIKNLVQRLRPCHEPSLEGLIHLVDSRCGGKYSFVSSHATNMFDVALLSLLFIRKRWYTISILAWASLISYSRIYLGVHYPGDVLCGALLGTLIGWTVYSLYGISERNLLCQLAWFNPPPVQK